MICCNLKPAACCFVFLILGASTVGRAEEVVAENPTGRQKAANEPQLEEAAPIPIPPFATCKPPTQPVYIEDWGRLADLTQTDRTVSVQAEFWAGRQQTANWVLATGLVLGGGAVALSTFQRLDSGSWTNTNKWGVAGGISVALVSLLVAWAYSPDRDDLLTVINHWNLRHPDRPLAP